MQKNPEIEMSEDDESDYENATCCHICKKLWERMTSESEIAITKRVAVFLTDATYHI